jgi:hypothetical protein
MRISFLPYLYCPAPIRLHLVLQLKIMNSIFYEVYNINAYSALYKTIAPFYFTIFILEKYACDCNFG